MQTIRACRRFPHTWMTAPIFVQTRLREFWNFVPFPTLPCDKWCTLNISIHGVNWYLKWMILILSYRFSRSHWFGNHLTGKRWNSEKNKKSETKAKRTMRKKWRRRRRANANWVTNKKKGGEWYWKWQNDMKWKEQKRQKGLQVGHSAWLFLSTGTSHHLASTDW